MIFNVIKYENDDPNESRGNKFLKFNLLDINILFIQL